jgi:hypothetical protein
LYLIIKKVVYCRNLLLISLSLLTISNLKCQDVADNSKNQAFGVNLGFRYDADGNTYGIILDDSKPLWINKGKSILLTVGLQEDFQIKMERGFEGASGSTLRNGVHLVFGPSFQFFKSRNVTFKLGFFGGWSFKSANGKIDNDRLNIHRSYSDSYHYFGRGIIVQSGYKFKKDIQLTAFYKADLRRLTNEDKIWDPDVLFGIGIIKIFNSH